MKQRINLLGPHENSTTLNNEQQTINWYLDKDGEGGRYEYVLRPTPGLANFAVPGGGTGPKGLVVHNNVLYYAYDSTYFASLSSGGSFTVKSSTMTSNTNTISFAVSNDQIFLVDDADGYTFTVSTNTFAKVTDADFPATPIHCTYQDGYFIVIEDNSQKFYISAINDGTSWDALDFASATAEGDKLVACASDHNELWLFGEYTTEVWYNSGDVDFPFAKRPGVLIQKGCAAKHTVRQIDNTIYWLATDKLGETLVVRANGYTPEVISNKALGIAMQDYTTSDAYAYVYRDKQSEFYVLTFPTDEVTWVYDSSTGFWHQRSSAVGGTTHHDSEHYAYCYGKHIVTTKTAESLVYELTHDSTTDHGTAITRTRTSQFIHSNSNWISMDDVVINTDGGATITLTMKKDGASVSGYSSTGNTFFTGMQTWPSLGCARLFELTFTATGQVTVLGAEASIIGEA